MDIRVEVVPRKRTSPEANGSTLPVIVGAVIYVRVSTKEQTENVAGIVRDRLGVRAKRGDVEPMIPEALFYRVQAAAMVTEATARHFWPGQDPVGRTIVAASSPETVLEIVGIVRDAHMSNVANTESTYLYLPAGPSVQRRVTFLVRGETDLDPLARSIRSTIRTLDAGLLAQVQPLGANLDFWRTVSRSVAALAGSSSALALVLASIGVYGVVSYTVTRRRREVGIRMALGASARAVQGLVPRETLRPVGLGVLLGVLAAAASSQLLERGLIWDQSLRPFMLTVATIATVLPTRNALKVDPVDALRHD